MTSTSSPVERRAVPREDGADRLASGSEDLHRVASLLAVDPQGLGGVALRSRPSAARDGFCAQLAELMPPEAPVVRLPVHVTEDRLIGGLSLEDTLRTGRAIMQTGLLARADGGLLVAAMAERMEGHVAAQVCAALDRGCLVVERDGLTTILPSRLMVIALDEGVDEERLPESLADRLAFWLEIDGRAEVVDLGAEAEIVASARQRLAEVQIDREALDALCKAAEALGVVSLRASLFAARVARAQAALTGRAAVEADDLALAARLVLAPRATRMPSRPQDEPESEERPEPPPPTEAKDQDAEDSPSAKPEGEGLEDVVLDAAESGIPRGLLDLLAAGMRPSRSTAGRAGARRRSLLGGRPAGVGRFAGRHGERLALVDTLRAAAPWQRLRRADLASAAASAAMKVLVRRDDFRARRFVQPTESTVIFAVDASGSAAARRLAEAKGAVETVLSDCYVRRDHVALVAFRGDEAAVVLPPTRSLTRVQRRLAALAGGGTTPLAAGIDAALALADQARKRGRTPVVVVMTDGRANVARDGSQGVQAATTDALRSARSLRAAGVAALLLDTSTRPRRRARELAEAMGARYLPLPYVDASGIVSHVRSLSEVSP